MKMEFKRLLTFFAWIFLSSQVTFAGPSTYFGVCYSMVAATLPPPSSVMKLIDSCGIAKFRLYEPHPEVMELHPDKLISIAARNNELDDLASSFDFAKAWVEENYMPYDNILDIVVGIEAIPGAHAKSVPMAMRNIRVALDQTTKPEVMVTTALSSAALVNTLPPSGSTFTNDSVSVMTDLIQYRNILPPGQQFSVYINVSPYHVYATDPEHISLDFALFQATEPGIKDGDLTYWNLFDAMYDSFVWALEKIGGGNVSLTVGQSGWPHAGDGNATTPQLASTYVTNLYNHILNSSGSPKDPNGFGDVYVFSLFTVDENAEVNWGLFDPNLKPAYKTPLCQ